MPLLTPILKGPLIEWCDTLLVEGAVAGATVFARAAGPNPRDLAKSVVSGGRNRKPRLAVVDAAAIDASRRLVLVRRDDAWRLAASHVSEPSRRGDPRGSHQ